MSLHAQGRKPSHGSVALYTSRTADLVHGRHRATRPWTTPARLAVNAVAAVLAVRPAGGAR